MAHPKKGLPLIDFGPFLAGDKSATARAIGDACGEVGFFELRGHGIDRGLLARIDRASRDFFALNIKKKMQISMSLGGPAWRGYFPVGGELTSGQPDLKEGLYFGHELGADDRRVKQGLPLHGANLFPDIHGFREDILAYIAAQTNLGHQLMKALSISLGLDENYFYQNYTTEPTVLYRIFHYPPVSSDAAEKFSWGVGEHTDYGLLTILSQDDRGGLEVKTQNGWLAVPPLEDVLVCNVGDMLDYLTSGRYRSVPHRVKNRSGLSRLSFPFFFDPGFAALMKPIPLTPVGAKPSRQRWDQTNLYDFNGSYGDYLLKKISKVFPKLAATKL